MTKARDLADFAGKADTIETSATADQTSAEIRAAVEAATDSNVFTDADHTKLNAIEASSTGDQTAAQILTAIKTVDGAASALDADLLDGQHGAYYTGYADTAVSNLVDSSPASLNTLNELAAALGDDASFSTTVTNSIAAKLPLAGGTMSGAIAMGTSKITGAGNPTAAQDLATKAYVDGASGAALPLSGGAMTGAITTNSTFDGVDIATRDAVLTSTTTTANAALPKAGGAVTGAITSAGALTLDAVGNINLDSADGGGITLKNAGTAYGLAFSASNSLTLKSTIPNGAMIFQGNDGGNAVAALTLDMQDAGTATFNHDIKLGDDQFIFLGAGQDMTLRGDGTNGIITSPNGNLTIDTDGDINLDANGGDVNLLDDGTAYAHLSNVSGELYVTAPTQDKAILFRGNDSNNFITALKLDMNDEGAAIFNSTIKLGTNRGIYIGGTSAANYLDHYETGTSTLTWSGTGGTANTSSTTWRYVRIGNLVTVSGNTSSALPNATGTIVLTGLPFASDRNAVGSILYRQLNAPSGMHNMVAFVTGGQAQIMPFWSGSNAYVQLNSSDFNANGAQDMYMTVSYTTA